MTKLYTLWQGFSDRLAEQVDIHEGIKDNVLRWIFAPNVIDELPRLVPMAGNLWLYGEFHFNLS